MNEASREREKQYKKETRQWRKEHHICVSCGKQDAAIGFMQCGECIEKQSNKYYANKERHIAAVVARRKKLQEAGLCITCGKKRSEKSKRFCDSCLKKKRAFERKYYRRHKVYMSVEREAEVRELQKEGLKKAIKASMESPKAQENRKAWAERERKRNELFWLMKGAKRK